MNGTYGLANFSFSGQDLGASAADKGTAYYSDGSGSYYAKATDMQVTDANTATMTLKVTSSAHPDVPVDFTFTVTFHDGGEGTSLTPEGDYFMFVAPVLVPDHSVAEAGNIQIHNS
jgi:hypothetical protein